MVNSLATFDLGVPGENVIADTNGISQIIEGVPVYTKGYHGGAAVRTGSSDGVTNHRFRVPLGVLGNHYGSVYMKNNTAHGSTTASVNFFYIQTENNSYLAYFRVRPDNALSIRLNDGTEVRAGSAGDIPVGSWFRMDWQVTGTTVNWRVHYDPDGTTPDLSGSVDASAIVGTLADKIILGVQSNNAEIIRDWSFDTVRASNSAATWLAPYPGQTIKAKWSGKGLTPGPMNTSSAGPGDLTFGFVSTGITIDDSGPRPPRIKLSQVLGNNCYVAWGNSRFVTPLFEGAIRMYAEFTGWGDDPFSIFTAIDDASVTTWRFDVAPTTGAIRVRDQATQIVETAWSLPLNTLIRLEVVFTADLLGLYVFEGDSAVPLNEVEIGPISRPQTNGIRFGNNSAGYVIPTWYSDEILVIEQPTLIGPVGPEEASTPVTIWNGTEEVPATVTLWDGTQEVPITLEVV